MRRVSRRRRRKRLNPRDIPDPELLKAGQGKGRIYNMIYAPFGISERLRLEMMQQPYSSEEREEVFEALLSDRRFVRENAAKCLKYFDRIEKQDLQFIERIFKEGSIDSKRLICGFINRAIKEMRKRQRRNREVEDENREVRGNLKEEEYKEVVDRVYYILRKELINDQDFEITARILETMTENLEVFSEHLDEIAGLFMQFMNHDKEIVSILASDGLEEVTRMM